MVNFLRSKFLEVHFKLLISQSKFSDPRKFIVDNSRQSVQIIFFGRRGYSENAVFEIMRVICIKGYFETTEFEIMTVNCICKYNFLFTNICEFTGLHNKIK